MTKDFSYPNIPVSYPTTEKIEHTDTYGGVEIRDDFHWLEDDNAEDTKAWVTAQNETTFGYLDKIPFRQAFADRMEELIN